MKLDQERWAASLLDIQPEDQILEIDCGYSCALEEIAGEAPGVPAVVVDSSTPKRRPVRTQSAASVPSVRVALHPGKDTRLPFRDDQFNKAILFTAGQCTPQPKTLHEVRRVLTRDCRIAVVQWPVTISMSGGSFRPEYDDLVQRSADELKVRLQEVGFEGVRLRFKPTDPIATLCAVADGRVKTGPCTSFPLFSGFWW